MGKYCRPLSVILTPILGFSILNLEAIWNSIGSFIMCVIVLSHCGEQSVDS
jgi:hypothetical protein